jgi:hypothetical protein
MKFGRNEKDSGNDQHPYRTRGAMKAVRTGKGVPACRNSPCKTWKGNELDLGRQPMAA